MIALRKRYKAFGRGTLEFLHAGQPQGAGLHPRATRASRSSCVANLSRFVQPVELDLSALAGRTPVEMLGYVEFPKITRVPYGLTLGPYGVFWFELHGELEPVEAPPETVADVTLVLAGGSDWAALAEPAHRTALEARILPAYLPRQRWFGGKSRTIKTTRLVDWIGLSAQRRACCWST